MSFRDQEYDLQEAAERYTRELDRFRKSGSTDTRQLSGSARVLAKCALRFAAMVVDDRVPNPNARERELPAKLENLADRFLLERLASGPEARIETGPPEPSE